MTKSHNELKNMTKIIKSQKRLKLRDKESKSCVFYAFSCHNRLFNAITSTFICFKSPTDANIQPAETEKYPTIMHSQGYVQSAVY